TAVSEATGLSQTTIRMGIAEHRACEADPNDQAHGPHLRHPGGGRKRLSQADRTLLNDLEALVDPSTRGDPQSPLRWTCKSTRRLAQPLREKGHRGGGRAGAALLKGQGARAPWPPCSRGRATACRATARPTRAGRTRTATPSSSTSPGASGHSSDAA